MSDGQFVIGSDGITTSGKLVADAGGTPRGGASGEIYRLPTKSTCGYCGNERIPDKRGGCSACGAPVADA